MTGSEPGHAVVINIVVDARAIAIDLARMEHEQRDRVGVVLREVVPAMVELSASSQALELMRATSRAKGRPGNPKVVAGFEWQHRIVLADVERLLAELEQLLGAPAGRPGASA